MTVDEVWEKLEQNENDLNLVKDELDTDSYEVFKKAVQKEIDGDGSYHKAAVTLHFMISSVSETKHRERVIDLSKLGNISIPHDLHDYN